MDVSLVIPLLDEEDSILELCNWIDKVMKNNNLSYEVFLVDDGSRDKSWDIIERQSLTHSSFHGIKFRRNYGKSAALNIGFSNAQGNVVITMDADLQDSPEEIQIYII